MCFKKRKDVPKTPIYYTPCPYDGLLLRISIYPGQPYVDQQNLGQCGAVVLHLVHGFLDRGFSLFVYYYYNSYL